MNPFLEVTLTRVLNGRKFVSKSHTKLFGQVWGTSGKNPSHAQKFACSYTYLQGLARNTFAGVTKSGKISFSPLETKKTTFLQKNLMGKCQISKS